VSAPAANFVGESISALKPGAYAPEMPSLVHSPFAVPALSLYERFSRWEEITIWGVYAFAW